MNWFYRLKYKYQKYAVKNLSMYVTMVFAIGFLLMNMPVGNALYWSFFSFTPNEVLHGQIWRILTSILYPPFANSGILFGLLGIYIYYNFASIVEQMMGEFEFNVYFFGSLLIGELGAVLYFLITGNNAPFLPVYTQFSVFMAFAVMYPDAQILLMFAIPLKAKVLAWIEVFVYVYYFLFGDGFQSLVYGMLYTRINIAAALIPIGLFYLLVYNGRNGGGNIISNWKFKMRQRQRRKEWRDQWK